MINYYDILEVSPTASQEQIKEAYKKISVKVHPDKYGGDEYYTEIFQAVNEARIVLTDEAKRAEYDQQLKRSFRSNSNNAHRASFNLNKKWIFLLSGTAAFLIFVILLPSSDLKQLQQQPHIADANSSIPKKNEANRSEKQIEAKSLIGSVNEVEPVEEKANKTLPNSNLLEPLPNRPGLQSKVNRVSQNKTFLKNSIKPTAATELPIAGLVKGLPPVQVQVPVAGPINTIEEKRINEAQMLDILKQVRVLKANSETMFNCVRILKTKNSNVQNAFDLAAFLKSNGFIISGRETVEGEVEGVEVKENEGCFYVTIGVY